MARRYTTQQVAKLIGTTPRTIYRWIDEKSLPECQEKLGRVRAWTEEEIERARRCKAEFDLRSKPLQHFWTKSVDAANKLMKQPKYKKMFNRSGQAFHLFHPGKLTDDNAPSSAAYKRARNTLLNASMLHVDEEPMTVKELAAWLKVPVSTIYELTREKRAKARDRKVLPHVKVGRQMRFSKRDVINWLHAQQEAKLNH